ncbi:MAG: AMP-binding protein [Nitrospirae bacterium]|nr:AMP-binding protein [Nitrospirota bacterium]
MSSIPFLHGYTSNSLLARQNQVSITCPTFLAHVKWLAQALPDYSYVLNLCEDRYWFLVGFAAALERKQISLLPPNRVPEVIRQIGKKYYPCYCLIDTPGSVEGIPVLDVTACQSTKEESADIPIIPEQQVAVIVFTSGSTGEPRPNLKTWGSLVSVANKTREGLGQSLTQEQAIVGTVPQQHMYGLETSIMLAIQSGLTIHSTRPFFPEDIRQALSEFNRPSLLITTPLHIRACLIEQTQLPSMAGLVSATAPLPLTLAKEAEERFHSPVLEIYGFTEAGTIAIRRPVTCETWQLLEGLSLIPEGEGYSVKTDYLPDSIPVPDRITVKGSNQFVLHGRPASLVNIAGRRISLDDLNFRLNQIDGVRDGVFFMPDELDGQVTRLVAFVVAPKKTSKDILKALRGHIDPVFSPRPLYFVESLPRNPTGKLPRESLCQLLETMNKHLAQNSQNTVSDPH